MRIQLLQSRASAAGPQNVGDVIEVDAAEGKRLIAAGVAEPVRSRKSERAVRREQSERADA